LFVAGYTTRELSSAVPAVAGWAGSSLPRPLLAEDVAALLAGGDGTAVGLRDHAVLVVLARLGLRAGEVAGLDLDDVDWRAGELVVRGKGARRDRLPVPVDVGEALVAYLQGGRPRAGTRALFVRAHAPIGRVSAKAVGGIVRRACLRQGLAPSGAHRLRHSAATAILGGGGSLAEVGLVLRHARLSTSALYAKVDRVALRELAQPWPGSAS
jgi:site-specific recombinase XerC